MILLPKKSKQVLGDNLQLLKQFPLQLLSRSEIASRKLSFEVTQAVLRDLVCEMSQECRLVIPYGRQSQKFSPLLGRSCMVACRSTAQRLPASSDNGCCGANLRLELTSARPRFEGLLTTLPVLVGEATGDPISSTQATWYVSDYIQELLGYTVEEWLTTPSVWLKIVHYDDQERVRREARTDFSNARSQTIEFRSVAKDGRVVRVEAHTSVITDDEGNPIGLCGLNIDTTKRKCADEQLRQLAAALDQAAESILIADAGANIIYVNPAFEKASGYSRAELIGKNPRPLKSGRVSEEFYSEMWPTLPCGKVWPARFVNRKKDRSLHEIEGTISPVLDSSGKVVSYVSVRRDVTHENKLEEQLRQSQKMEAVGQLAGGIAHDFNNLLTAINGYSALALMKISRSDPLRAYLGEIKKAGDRAANLTGQLLAFSRKQILEPRNIDLNDTVAEMQKMLKRILGEHICLRVQLHDSPLWVLVDLTQMEQVIVNLAVNARDAMPDGGDLTIETSETELLENDLHKPPEAKTGKYHVTRISDTGIGMSDDMKARVFEPFFTTKGLGKGTGLGLATVYGIVEQSGGFITLQSELGRGTTFEVYLPRIEIASTLAIGRQSKEAIREDSKGTETVLLVEDEDIVRAIARTALEMRGYTVIEAANAGEALLLAQQHERIDLVLTDVIMPRMNGKLLIGELKKSRPDLRVLYMSGYTDDTISFQGGLVSGEENFLQKPFTPDALTRKIRSVLDTPTADVTTTS